MTRLNIELVNLQALKAYPRNARLHSRKQIEQIAQSIRAFGFVNPLLIDQDNEVIAGHGRLEAARSLKMEEIPCIRLGNLSAAQKAALRIADNKIALNATWDEDLLAQELGSIASLDVGFELTLTGFAPFELDGLMEGPGASESGDMGEEVVPEPPPGPSVCRTGDVWKLGPHRLICGNALDPAVVASLMGGMKAQMVFSDPPYNLAVRSISGLGKTRHGEFAMASGEMSREEFTGFLKTAFQNLAANAVDGAIVYLCGDWRHLREYLDAGEAAFTELKNLIVWDKLSGGMGTFYRSRHELIFAFKNGQAPHINTFKLGQHGRQRSNVWPYRGLASFGPERDAALASHPTVKPVALIADAIRDASSRGGIILDLFGGSGSTLIAAHKTGRRACLCEIDPRYCDTIIGRYQAHAKDDAVLEDTGETFEARSRIKRPILVVGD